jgi:hypothetical protein
LQHPVHPFHTAFGLRTIGQNQSHSQRCHRSAKLRLPFFPGQLVRYARGALTAIDAVPIHIQTARQPVFAPPAFKHIVAGPRRFFLRKPRPHPVGRVIHHHHQHAFGPPPFKPVVVRAVQLYHRPETRLALPPLPVLLLPAAHAQLPLGQQPPPHRVVIHLEPLLGQFLGQQCRAEVRIALLGVARQHLRSHGGCLAPQPSAPTQPMDQPGIALRLIPPPDAFGLPIAQAHQFSRLHLRQFFPFHPSHDRHPVPFLPTHCQCLHVAAGWHPPSGPFRDISIKLQWGHSH